MGKYSVLMNPRSGNGKGAMAAEQLKKLMPEDVFEILDVTRVKDYRKFFANLDADTQVILAGGDGTLNHFVNDTEDIPHGKDIYYFATGSGNDFLKDIGYEQAEGPIRITSYLKNLPQVLVNGKRYRFFNAIGYGIDGYCCEVGDIQRTKTNKTINYTKIALKGLLYDYKPTNAIVTVDGVTREYKRVWLAPTMKGRYFGGGMMAAPNQDRMDPEGRVSVMVMRGGLRPYILSIFPTIFTGKHLNYQKIVSQFLGHSVKVQFDRPTALQIDGETVLNVTEYEVLTSSPVSSEKQEILA